MFTLVVGSSSSIVDPMAIMDLHMDEGGGVASLSTVLPRISC